MLCALWVEFIWKENLVVKLWHVVEEAILKPKFYGKEF